MIYLSDSLDLGVFNSFTISVLLSFLLNFLQMFDNIASLDFGPSGSGTDLLAKAMISAEGEVMLFREPVLAEGPVEDWMTCVLNEMRRTNRLITKEAIFYYCYNRTRYCYNRTRYYYNRTRYYYNRTR